MNTTYNERVEIAMNYNENNVEGLRFLLKYCNDEQRERVLALLKKDSCSLEHDELNQYNEEKWALLAELGVDKEDTNWAIAIPVAETCSDRDLKIGDIVIHFKHTMNPANSPAKYMYEIVNFAKHTETGEQLVVYRSIFDHSKVFARPYDMFMGETDTDKYPEATQKYRLEKVTNLGDIVDYEGINLFDRSYTEQVYDELSSWLEELKAEGERDNVDILSNALELIKAIYT